MTASKMQTGGDPPTDPIDPDQFDLEQAEKQAPQDWAGSPAQQVQMSQPGELAKPAARDGRRCFGVDARVPGRTEAGKTMTEEPIIIRMNIAHYGALLKLDLSAEKRSQVERLLVEAHQNLVLASVERNQDSMRVSGA